MSNIELLRIGIPQLKEWREIFTRTYYDLYAQEKFEFIVRAYMDHGLSTEQLKSELNNPCSEFYLAKWDGSTCGCMKINIGEAQTNFQDKNGLEIEHLFVLK